MDGRVFDDLLNEIFSNEGVGSLVYQVRDFEEFRRSFVVQIASAYFRLINTRQQVDNTLTNYISTVNQAGVRRPLRSTRARRS